MIFFGLFALLSNSFSKFYFAIVKETKKMFQGSQLKIAMQILLKLSKNPRRCWKPVCKKIAFHLAITQFLQAFINAKFENRDTFMCSHACHQERHDSSTFVLYRHWPIYLW